jgi:hypothetical protein
LAEVRTKPDISSLAGDVFFRKKQLLEALEQYQKGWSEYDGKGGYAKYGFAFDAATCCLYLGQLHQAKDWLKAGEMVCDKYQAGVHEKVELNIQLALAEAQSFSSLPVLLRQLDNQAQVMQNNASKDTYNMLAVRVALLANPDLDPMQRHHPISPPLMQRLRHVKSVHEQYQYRLLLLDVRLAALRFCTRIAPVDDLYYARPQQLPAEKNAIDMNQLRLRVQKALQTARQAERYGRKIDEMLECDWRQEEVQERCRRIMEIARHYSLDAETIESN